MLVIWFIPIHTKMSYAVGVGHFGVGDIRIIA